MNNVPGEINCKLIVENPAFLVEKERNVNIQTCSPLEYTIEFDCPNPPPANLLGSTNGELSADIPNSDVNVKTQIDNDTIKYDVVDNFVNNENLNVSLCRLLTKYSLMS